MTATTPATTIDNHLAPPSFVASTPPALASLLTPLAGGSPQALCCAGVSPRALFGGGRSVHPDATTMMASTKRELLPPAAPAVDDENDDDAELDKVGEPATNTMGGLTAATHAVSL